MEHLIDQIVEESGLSKSALAARSGLARSTQYRIRDHLVDPTVGSLRELALAAGFDLVLSLAPLSDPDAARAARVLLDPRFELSGSSRDVEAWVERLRRWVPTGDPVEVVRTAGQSSSLLNRPTALFLRGNVTELKLASAGDFSKAPWLLSGAPVIDRIGGPEADRHDSGTPYVVYSADPQRFARLLDNMDKVRPEKANLIIAEYSNDLAADEWEDGKIKLVAPIQALIDAFGVGGNLARAAEQIARSW